MLTRLNVLSLIYDVFIIIVTLTIMDSQTYSRRRKTTPYIHDLNIGFPHLPNGYHSSPHITLKPCVFMGEFSRIQCLEMKGEA